MTEPEDLEEDLFADLYDGDTPSSRPAPAPPQSTATPTIAAAVAAAPDSTDNPSPNETSKDDALAAVDQDHNGQPEQTHLNDASEKTIAHGAEDPQSSGWANGQHPEFDDHAALEQEPQSTGIKEDGKMFIGGLNWETTDQSLKEYFSQYGEVVECTVMRDGATGRSRGFGFLTFKDPKTVNIVMVKEHFLDGKIIDPKRAIPRDEQEKTSKIFVGGVSQEATEQDFKRYFMQFGRVLDATLMMDKDTGRPRGFGFVTFDSEAAVEATLSQPLEIHGKPIEVKKAQPRGNMRDHDDDRGDRRFGRRGRDGHDRFERDGHRNSYDDGGGQDKGPNQNQQFGQGLYGGMTPQMMAQYWQRMQQYFAMMQQQMAAAAAATNQGRGVGAPMNMAAMNPAMLQQMTAMQSMSRQGSQGTQSPQAVGGQGMQNLSPAMIQQFQQMQQMQQQAQQQLQQPGQQQPQQVQQGLGGGMQGGNMGGVVGGGRDSGGGGFNPYEQQMFEQRKFEQQQGHGQPRRGGRDQGPYGAQFQGTPTSWEGMYDDVPQPGMVSQGPGAGAGGGMQQGFQRQPTPTQGGRGLGGPNRPSPAPQSSAPANAPTGPKNAGRPGANYRGGGRGGGVRGYHPYSRP